MTQTPTQRRSDRPAAAVLLALASFVVAGAGSVLVSRLPAWWDVFGVIGVLCAAFLVGFLLPVAVGGDRR